MTTSTARTRPPFESLPLDPNGPSGNAWGLYGPDDNLGALNLITPAVVASAAAEIKTGICVSLDWPLDRPARPSFGRDAFKHKVINWGGKTVYDDVLEFNTQGSSQWDGFRHYGYQQACKFYNGHGHDDLSDPTVLGIDAWTSEKGGIVGRGILLDYVRYCEKNSIKVDVLSSSSISLSHIKGMLKDQDLAIRSGDVLLIRSGVGRRYESMTAAEQDALAGRPSADFLGVEPCAEVLQWLWESEFAAVAGDMPSFERCPIRGAHTVPEGGNGERLWAGQPWEMEMQGGGLLHQWLLGGWGCPIGEMFDLESLAKQCEELGRWTFFLTSSPLKVPGGVASPPNAIAIF